MIFFIPTEGTVTQENDKSQVGREKIFLVILNHKKKTMRNADKMSPPTKWHDYTNLINHH